MAARRVYNWVKGIDSLFQAAVVQLNSDSDWERNWLDAESLIRQAVGAGAAFVATPENTPFLGPHKEKVRRAESLDGATCRAFGALAEELGIHLLLGSFAERSDDPDRCYNT
ncbi:MAG: carbon-nitrogen hydrolase family protein, partial [marine benthic group bacterium]|nr:carbon-nitrogen hydrolase family protein [Gemmatimonadota bacterium]